MTGVKVSKYKKTISIMLLVFCALSIIFTISGVIASLLPQDKVYIKTSVGNIKLQLTDKITLKDDDKIKLESKLKLESTNQFGELGKLVKVTSNNIMFYYSVNNKTYYFSAIDKEIRQISESLYQDSDGKYKLSYSWDLQDFRKMVNNGNKFIGDTVYLSRDIDLKGENWVPIGTYGWQISIGKDTKENYFSGTFDGCGKTISNFIIKPTNMRQYAYLWNSETFHVGLFGLLKGTVKNLKLSQVQIDMYTNEHDFRTLKSNVQNEKYSNYVYGYDKEWDTPMAMGCLSGSTAGATIENVEVDDSCYIKYVYGATDSVKNQPFHTLGGLVGLAFSTNFTNCSSAIKISAVLQDFTDISDFYGASFFIGGIAGGSIFNTGVVADLGIEINDKGSAYKNCLFTGQLQAVGRATNAVLAGISGGETKGSSFTSCAIKYTDTTFYRKLQACAARYMNNKKCYARISLICAGVYEFGIENGAERTGSVSLKQCGKVSENGYGSIIPSESTNRLSSAELGKSMNEWGTDSWF